MTLGIIQARTGSTRFPNKILYKIGDKTLLELMINRVKKSKLLDKIIVATTTNPNDDKLCELIKSWGIEYFRGDENDLLDRYYQCAKEFKGDVIVRLGSDDVFMDPNLIDRAVKIYNDNPNLDFITNHFSPQTYPEGLELEVYSFKTLESLWRNATLKSDREHVFIYLQRNQNKFNIYNFTQKKDQSHIRLTLDYECDYDLTKKIYEYWGSTVEIPLQADIINILTQHPELLDLNSKIKRYEGINKSIANDGGIQIK